MAFSSFRLNPLIALVPQHHGLQPPRSVVIWNLTAILSTACRHHLGGLVGKSVSLLRALPVSAPEPRSLTSPISVHFLWTHTAAQTFLPLNCLMPVLDMPAILTGSACPPSWLLLTPFPLLPSLLQTRILPLQEGQVQQPLLIGDGFGLASQVPSLLFLVSEISNSRL